MRVGWHSDTTLPSAESASARNVWSVPQWWTPFGCRSARLLIKTRWTFNGAVAEYCLHRGHSFQYAACGGSVRRRHTAKEQGWAILFVGFCFSGFRNPGDGWRRSQQWIFEPVRLAVGQACPAHGWCVLSAIPGMGRRRRCKYYIYLYLYGFGNIAGCG